VPKRSGPNAGPQTREAVLATARRLFTTRGYDSTSMRDIAAELGLTNAALYYHFPSKDALLTALAGARRREIDDLALWARAQPDGPGLLRATAIRWLDTATQERLDGVRFALANRATLSRAVEAEANVPAGVEELVTIFADGSDPARRLVVRLVFEAFSCAALAATPDDDLPTVVAAARIVVLALTTTAE